ncbi:MAG: PH domain-containing protein [Patescibacteria group bacterium]|nr:PH domain-containing protein [Patescibacteria group bacterium]
MPDIFDASDYKKESKKNKVSKKKSPRKTIQKKNFPVKNGCKVDAYSQTLRNEKPTNNPLKAFAAKPVETEFDSQLEGEEIVLMLRRHPITLFKPVVISLIIFFLPFLFFSSPMLNFMTSKLITAFVIGWYMILTSFVLESFLTWFFNVFIITDERIIDVDFSSLIFKNVSSAKIDNIEDITVATGGVVASIVDYGTVYIQTSAEVPELEFEDVPNPNKVSKVLNELMLEEEQEKIEGRVR